MLLIHTGKLSLFQTEEVLRKVKNYLASGHPAMFGFMVYNSIEQAMQAEGFLSPKKEWVDVEPLKEK